MTLGEFITLRRNELGMSRNALAVASGVSHTEVNRIETGDRKQPSVKNIKSLASVLLVPAEDLMKYAGYIPSDDISPVERAFPGLKTEKQRQTVETIVEGLSRNSELADEDLDELCKQLDRIIVYAKNKKDSD